MHVYPGVSSVFFFARLNLAIASADVASGSSMRPSRPAHKDNRERRIKMNYYSSFERMARYCIPSSGQRSMIIHDMRIVLCLLYCEASMNNGTVMATSHMILFQRSLHSPKCNLTSLYYSTETVSKRSHCGVLCSTMFT